MKSRIVFLFFTLLLILGSGFLHSPFAAFALDDKELAITEINAFGSTHLDNCKTNQTTVNRCSYDKWLKIKNTSLETIDTNGWSLQFHNSLESKYNLALVSRTLQPQQELLIAYTEKNFQNTFGLVGITADQTSSKLLYLSNRENLEVQINLIHGSEIIQNISFDYKQLQPLVNSESSHSLVYNNGNWEQSINQYAPFNFGTPQQVVVYSNTKDINANPLQSSVVVPLAITDSNLTQSQTLPNSASVNPATAPVSIQLTQFQPILTRYSLLKNVQKPEAEANQYIQPTISIESLEYSQLTLVILLPLSRYSLTAAKKQYT